MTVDSVSSGNAELLQLIQQAARQRESPEASNAGSLAGNFKLMGQGPPPGPNPMEDKLASYAEAAGLDEETIESLKDDVRAAVSTAFEQSDGGSDPRTVADAAIQSTLEAYGLDGEAFLSEMQAEREAMDQQRLGGLSQFSADDSASTAWSQLIAGAQASTDGSSLLSSFALLDTLA